ncbi:MAG: ComEC/Rec2 family competence protein [Devosia sp.]
MQRDETLDHETGRVDVSAREASLPMLTAAARQSPAKSSLWSRAMVAVATQIAARRLFIMLPFAMIAGLIGYAVLSFEPQTWALAGVGLAMVLALVPLRRSAKLPLFALLGAFWVGFCLLPVHGLWFGTVMLEHPTYGAFGARIDEIVSATESNRRVIVSALTPLEGGRAVPISRARLVVPPQPPLAPGDMISAKIRLAPVPGPILPGSYDGQFHAYFAGIGAYGTVTSGFVQTGSGSQLDLSRRVEQLRMGIGGRLDQHLDGASAAIGRAMVVGDQSGITDETRAVMANAGLAHIYSISGLHLSIVAGGVFWLVRWLLAATPAFANRWPVKKLAAIAGLLAAVGYLLLAGGLGNVPALRSTMMLGLIFGAVLAGRRALTMRNVAIAALAVMVIDPASVFRASFQLSFAAVVALIGIYEMPRTVPGRDRPWLVRMVGTVWATAATSFIAGTATLLFSAYHFQQTAPLGVIGNVLVLPVVSLVIMPFGVLSVLAMPLGIEAPFFAVMGWGIDRMVDGATLVAGWSEGLTGNPLLTGWALIVGLVALAWFAFFSNRWRLLGPAMAVPLIVLFGLDQRPDVLIADTTQAVAVRHATGMALVSGRTGSFAVDVWSEHYQEDIAAAFPDERCDSLGCIANTPQFSIAIIKNAAAFAEDCGSHDLVITRLRAPRTRVGSLVIDSDDLMAGGVHWLVWDEAAARFDVRTAIPNLNRPWRVARW